MKWIKRLFQKKYTEAEILTAMATCGNANDREDFEWKFKNALFRKTK